MASNERVDWGIAIVCTVATVTTLAWLVSGGGRNPATPSVPATVAPSTPGPVLSRSVDPGTQELPDCGYRLPPCVRLEGGQWLLVNDYQGDRRPVTLVTSVVRGDVVYRVVKG